MSKFRKSGICSLSPFSQGGYTRHTMNRARHFLLAGLLVVLGIPCLRAETLPAQLSDEQFWKISSEFSEPDGFFRSDNLLSNEAFFQHVLPDLTKTAKSGRVYLGVGPEQNYTFMTAIKPKIAFIIDIRRGNLDLQLMYKALFELSRDRAEFVSRLFCRPRPAELTTESTANAIFEAYRSVQRTDALYQENLKSIQSHLTSQHGFALSEGDLSGIEYVYQMFCRFGPEINYNSSAGGFGGGANRTTYAELMIATDQNGLQQSYLANEDNFKFLKDLQTRNLVIPVVGNFAGTKAIRAVSQYLKDADATVSAFYLSNVEQYLYMDGIWTDFCRNASALPLDPSSMFILSVRGGRFGNSSGLNSDVVSMIDRLKPCAP